MKYIPLTSAFAFAASLAVTIFCLIGMVMCYVNAMSTGFGVMWVAVISGSILTVYLGLKANDDSDNNPPCHP